MIEGMFRLYIRVGGEISLGHLYELWSQNPAMTSEPWFSREFAAASLAQPPEGCTPTGTSIKIPADYQDRFFTVRDGSRATVGFDRKTLPPGRRPRKLFVFGGSTTYCAEVPNDLTWASQLQKRLATTPETRDIEVVNYGIHGAVAFQEVGRLEYEIRRKNIPDFCVFFDGINEVFQGVIFGEPGGTHFGTFRKHTDTSLFTILRQAGRVSVAATTIYHSILDSQRQNDLPHTRSQAKLRELAQATANVYERELVRGQEICNEHGIRMIVCLQPNLFMIGRPLTSQEIALKVMDRKSHVSAFQTCYPFLRDKVRLLQERGMMAYDLTDAFNGTIEPIFVDGSHVGATGNRLIGEAILTRALPALRGPLSMVGALPSRLDQNPAKNVPAPSSQEAE
jgi:lysophospholipase L1-like esterase